MSATIPDSHRDLLDRPIVVSFVTMMADGQPQATPVWCNYDGSHVLINSARGRQKDKNISDRPKVTILSIDPDNVFRWIEIRGVVEEQTEEGAKEHIHELSQLYTGKRYYGGYAPAEREHQETRVIYKIRPTHVIAR